VKPNESQARLLKRMGKPIKDLTAREGIDAMLAFYKEQRAKCAPLDEDGDMLLYQWGAEGKTFMLDLTRQFILPDEDEPYQLSLTFRYRVDDELGEAEGGNEWCSTPKDLPAFRKFIDASEPFRHFADRKPRKVETHFTQC
jgi:hypothetical protein